MTGPITFDPTPFPVLDDACDGVAAFSGVSTVSGTNFAKVQQFLASPPARWARVESRQTVHQVNQGGGQSGGFVAIPNYWAPFNYTVPEDTNGLWLNFYGQVMTYDPGYNVIYYGLQMSGPGLAAGTEDIYNTTIMSRGSLIQGSRHRIFAPSELVPKGVINCVPMIAYHDAYGQSGSRFYAGVATFLSLSKVKAP